MYDFKIEAADKATMYSDLASALQGLVEGEPDAIANMANAAGLIYEALPDVNWVGFYRNIGGELVLGPFQGRPACIRIPFGQGVCGVAAASREVQRIEDVHAFPGHIACDSASESEIVVPLIRDGELLGVLDIDSPKKARFDEEDEEGCVKLGEIWASQAPQVLDSVGSVTLNLFQGSIFESRIGATSSVPPQWMLKRNVRAMDGYVRLTSSASPAAPRSNSLG